MSRHFTFISNIRSILTLLVTTAIGLTPLAGKEYKLVDHNIRWTGSTLVKSHTGLLSPSEFSASISESGEIESLSVRLDMNSIDVTDLEGRRKSRLTNHLMSEDFFFAERYPEAMFIMKEYKEGKMHGTISIRGVPASVAIPVEVSGSPENGWVLSGRFSFNRQHHNVNYANAGIIGIAKDKIIDDAIELDIELKLKSSQ